MTNSEIRTNEAVQNINRKLRDQNKIDWEQRRYEIAKGMMPYFVEDLGADWSAPGSEWQEEFEKLKKKIASRAVEFADALIEELKEKRNEEV